MEMKDYFNCLVNRIHTTVVATTDDRGLPVTCAIDLMDYDESGLYFLTAKGKGFYSRLKKDSYLSLTGIKGESTMTSTAVSIRGKVRELGYEKTKELFDKNPYMYDIYPTDESQKAISVFQIYEGSGEWFDLSKKPIERSSFVFGGAETAEEGYFVNNNCIGCMKCYLNCPQKCIDITSKPVKIEQKNCLHCGRCFDVCPVKVVEKRG